MKKILIDNNHQSFYNKNKFDELLIKIKAANGSLIKNEKKTLTLDLMTGDIIFSAANMYIIAKNMPEVGNFMLNYYSTTKQSIRERNYYIESLSEEDMYVTNGNNLNINSDYYYENGRINEKNSGEINLSDIDKTKLTLDINDDEKTLSNIELLDSKITHLTIETMTITDEFINYLPPNLKELTLKKCNFITDLSSLGKQCPNITKLSIDSVPLVSDFRFLNSLENLEEVYIYESAYITEQLINYLNSRDIKTNIGPNELIDSQKIDEIVASIIDPSMDDKEKIQAICLYVLNNIEYDSTSIKISNDKPLSSVLATGKGVCISYSYLTTVLMNKAEINTYGILNNFHAWNMVEVDEKYYYIDPTNMDNKIFYQLLDSFNASPFCFENPENNSLGMMTNASDIKTAIPSSLIEDIKLKKDDKELFKKYSGQISSTMILLATILYSMTIAISGKLYKKAFKLSKDLIPQLKKDYEDELENHNFSKQK